MTTSGGQLNPYASPIADEGDLQSAVGSIRLYSTKQIGVAAFLGSPLAGAWLFAKNYSALRDRGGAHRALALGLLGTAALVAIGAVLPGGSPSSFLPLVCAWLIQGLAKRAHGQAFARHIAAGGEQQSWWRTIGVTFAVLALLVVVVLPLAWILKIQ